MEFEYHENMNWRNILIYLVKESSIMPTQNYVIVIIKLVKKGKISEEGVRPGLKLIGYGIKV